MMMMMMMRGLRIRTIIGRYGYVRRHAMASTSNVEDDTIFSLASGQGRAGVAVLRISGPLSTDALSEMTEGKKLPDPRVATVRNLKSTYDGSILDRAMILRFEKPKSFTGEDVVEFHLHGGPAVVAATIQSLSNMKGLRHAHAGEFTRRAFMNGKVDLTEVEGLADLIEAETEAQRVQAARQMRGELSKMYDKWRSELLRALAMVEAVIDFADEEEDVGESVLDQTVPMLQSIRQHVWNHLDDGRRGEILRSGARVALVGPPNAGKSSLLNAISQRPAAIVSPLAGTTRDVVETSLNINGMPVTLSDTAGLRETNDPIERAGVERARSTAQDSILKLLVLDGDQFINNNDNEDMMIAVNNIADKNTVVVMNKIDLVSSEIANLKRACGSCFEDSDVVKIVFVSCTEEQGLDKVIDTLSREISIRLFPDSDEDGIFTATTTTDPVLTRERHRELLTQALDSLDVAIKTRDEFGPASVDIVAEELREAVRCVGLITGHVSVEEVLDVVFSSFCIGK